MVATAGPRPGDMLWLLLPRADYEIVDTWFASGMRGSGSKDIVITDAFVPAHRSMDPVAPATVTGRDGRSTSA